MKLNTAMANICYLSIKNENGSAGSHLAALPHRFPKPPNLFVRLILNLLRKAKLC